MPDQLPHVIIPVTASTGKAYEDFEALLNQEGTKALKDQWATLTKKLRTYLQIEYTPAASETSKKPTEVVFGNGSGKGTRRRP